jgi:hypothetical protein
MAPTRRAKRGAQIRCASAFAVALFMVFVLANGFSHMLSDGETQTTAERTLNPQELKALHRAHHARRVHTVGRCMLSPCSPCWKCLGLCS